MLNDIHSRYRAAAIQYESTLGQVEQNLAGLLALTEAAARRGGRLMVLPEMGTTGYCFEDRDEIAPLLESVPGPSTERFAALAARYACFVLIGIAEVDPATGAAYNTAALIGPRGFIGKMRKVHLTEGDSRWARPGDLGFPVWQTEIGRIGAHICLDTCFPEAARSAALNAAKTVRRLPGAQAIGLPTAWDGERAPAVDWFNRAYENGVYFIAADRYGRERDTQFSGGSCIIGPRGELLAHLDRGDGIVEAEIDLARTNSLDFEQAGDKFSGRRPQFYADLALNPRRWPLASRRHVYDERRLPEGRQFGIAVIQPGEIPASVGEARTQYETLIAQTVREAEAQVELVVLPELALVANLQDAASQAEAVPGPTTEWAAGLCKTHGLYLALGLPERAEDGALFNSAILVGPEGLIGVYRQIHLAERERAWATPGEDAPRTWDIEPLGRFGLMLGHDALYPELARCLAIQGADVICAPSAVEGPLPLSVAQTSLPLDSSILATPLEGHWHLWRGRAGENNCYVAFANRADGGGMGWSGVFGPDLFRYPRVEAAWLREQCGAAWLSVDTRDYLAPNEPNPVRLKSMVRDRNTQFVDALLK